MKEHENAEINLEVDLYDKLPEGTELGDIVYVIDDEGEVYASARLLKIEERDSTNEDIITLGDYIIKDSGISEQVAQLAADFKRLAETRERYTWIAYADDIYGTNISEYPDEHPYMGIAENMVGSTIDISDPTRFKWSRIAGKDPRDGTTRLWTGLSQPTEAPIGGQWYFSYSQLYDGDKYDAIVGDTIFFEGYYYLVHHIDGEDVWCYSRTDVNGADGKDGESPTIDLVRDGDNKNTKIVIHNPDGTTKESIVYDGADGEDPVIEAERVGNKTHIYVDGQEIAVVDDGADGKTPTITTNKVGDTTTVYVDGKSVATIKDGSNGVGINSVTITYGKSASASTMPTSWSSDIPSDLSDGEFLWTRTVIDYTDSEKPDTVSYTYAQQGKNGETGKAGTSVKVSKIEYQAGTSATTAPTGTWSTSVVSVSPGQYLWTKTTFSDNNVAYGVAYQGKNGADSTSYSILTSVAAVVYTKSKTLNPTSIVFSGKAQTGTNAMVNYSGRFKIETSTDGSTWTTTYSGTKNEASYTYTVPTGVSFIRGSLYLAGGLTTLLDQETVPVISEGTDGTNGKNGTNGTNGADGYTVLLTNDSHTFAAGTTAVVTAQSTVCGVIAYKGITQVAATIGTITGAPTGMTTTIANNGKTNAQVTVSVGTTMTTANGELKIPVTVDGKTFNLTFSYALAFTGAKGDKGNKGDKGDKGDSGITNGYTILWNYSAFSTANPAEAYICAYDQTTGKASDANGWVMFEGTKRTVTKGMVNPNSMAPFNIPIYIVERLSSATATTGTNYLVWYNSGWKYLTKGIDASATDQAVDKWTWAVTTDIILGMFVGPASEKAFVGMEIFDPPYSAKQITTNTITAAGASAAAETANTKVTTLETRVTNIEPELIIGTHGTTATATWTGKSKKIQHPSDIVAGTTIKFKLTSAGASNVTLNITCVDNTATGAKNVYFKGTTRLSTQYTSGSIINLMYDGTSWYVVSPYTNSTYNQGNVAYNNNVKAAAAIAKETIIVGTKAGYKQAAKDVTFDITYPILYAAEAIASGATSTNCWTQRASVSLTANKSDVSLVAYQKAYLVGTLAADNVTFKIDEIVFGTEPTEANGKIYLSIGLLYSTTQIHFDGGIQRPYAYAQIKNGTNVISSGFMPLELAKNTEISLSHKTYTVSTDSSIQTLTEWKGKITSQMETDSEEYAAYKEQIAKDLAEATKRIVGLEQTLDSIGFIIRVKPDDTEAQANTKKQTNKSQTDYLKEAGVLAKSFLKEDGFHVQTSGSQTQSILSGQELKMVNAAGQIMISVGASSTSLRNANLNGTAGQILTHDIKRGHRKELSVLIAEGSATVETLNFYWKGGNS